MPKFARTLYFPTPIYSFTMFDDAETMNEDLLALIYAERERDTKGLERSNFRSLGGWHSHNNLHKLPEFEILTRHIQTVTEGISNDLGYHPDYYLNIGTMWSIINAPGSSNRAHIHPDCLWSGVYYVHVPENSGDIEFTDPRTQHLMRTPKYIPNKRKLRECMTKVRISPMAGKMVIFPSWLYHAVHPNLSTRAGRLGERVIISFNLSQRKRPT